MNARERHLLKKYGLSLAEYDAMLKRQGGVCGICGNPPKTRSLHVDHEHVKNFKKLENREKRLFIRGLLCFPCNRIFMSRGMSIQKSQQIIKYLTAYYERTI